MGYQDEVAQWRQQRAQREIAERVEEIKQQYIENEQARDEAGRQQDGETFDYYDRECQALEQEFSQYVAPPQPELSPQTKQFLNQNADFVRKGGEAARQALLAAHQGAVNAGLQPDSADYFRWGKDFLEMYAGNWGVRFDPTAATPSPNEACRISGVTPELWNKKRQEALDKGAFSGTLYQNMWSKKVG
jgi:hypothetical protein